VTFIPNEIDIIEGDLLTVEGVDYPIRSVSAWVTSRASVRSLDRLATVRATTKRSPGIVNAKRGVPALHLRNLRCTPLDPVDPELKVRLALNTPNKVKMTFLGALNAFYQVIVEELK
jgi:hypothetical protein